MMEQINTYRFTCDKCKTDRLVGAKSPGHAEQLLQARANWVLMNAGHYCHKCAVKMNLYPCKANTPSNYGL